MYLDYTTEPQIPSRIYENGNFIIVMGNSAETTTIRFDLIKRQIQYDTILGDTVAEWLACWTQAQKAQVQIAVAMLSGNSLRQTVHTHCASVHQEAKLVATLLRIAGVTAGLAESNGSLPLGL